MMELFRNDAYKVVESAGNSCFSVRGNHAWVGEGPSFFIPAAKLKVGRIISIFVCLARRVLSKFRQVCRYKRAIQGKVALAGVSGPGKVVSRRL